MNFNFIIATLSFFAFCYVLGVFIFPQIRKLNPNAFDLYLKISLIISSTLLMIKLYTQILK